MHQFREQIQSAHDLVGAERNWVLNAHASRCRNDLSYIRQGGGKGKIGDPVLTLVLIFASIAPLQASVGVLVMRISYSTSLYVGLGFHFSFSSTLPDAIGCLPSLRYLGRMRWDNPQNSCTEPAADLTGCTQQPSDLRSRSALILSLKTRPLSTGSQPSNSSWFSLPCSFLLPDTVIDSRSVRRPNVQPSNSSWFSSALSSRAF